MFYRWVGMGLCAVALLFLANAPSQGQVVSIMTTDMGTGQFEYDITVNNAGGAEPIQGLLLFDANTLFGLDGSSVIGAPANWDFIPPAPPVVDQLSYFSLAPTADIPIGGVLDGFTFQSATDPFSVSSQQIQIDAVGSISGREFPVSVVPEPSALTLLFAIGVFTMLGFARRHKKAAFRARSCGLLAAVGLLALLAVPPAQAVLLVMPPGDVTVVEGTPDFRLTFTVSNPDNFAKVLDFALATITPLGPDTGDTTTFSGINGSNGLVNAPVVIPAGGTGAFIYSFQAPDDGKPDVDFGKNRVDFSIEMSPLPTGVIPPPNTLPSATGVVFVNPSLPGTTPDPNVLNQLQMFMRPTTPLYPGGELGQPDPATAIVTVLDTPESSGLALASTGILTLFGYTWRRRKKAA